jgi:Asp-tRNA(Asn)/Glu-tRNA(Gln) amidotransferase A subunit family amidase
MAYDPRATHSPRLSGAALTMVTALLERPLLGRIASGTLLRQIGVELFRSARFAETPSFFPPVPPPPAPDPSSTASAAPASTAPALLLSDELAQPSGGHPTVSDYARAYRESSISPEDVAERVVNLLRDRNHGDNPLYSFIAWSEDSIRRQAEESVRRIADGRTRSILEGVPVAVKDEIDVAGYPTSLGTGFLNRGTAEADAFVVAQLREAGAIILGKTNMHEIGIGITGLNPFHGTPVNPYAPGRYPGGSSSGSGSAVGAGICPIALGADGGGSVRIPAAFCGVFGLKMTWGRISTTGEYPLGRTVGNIGPIAAGARDLALAYMVTAAVDPMDAAMAGAPDPDLKGFTDDLRGVRIGVYPPWFEHGNETVVTTARSLVDRLAEAGAKLVEVEIPGLDDLRVAHLVTITLEMCASMETALRERRRDFGIETRANLALAQYLNTSDYLKAQQVRARTAARLQEVFQTVDVIATPTTANLPPHLYGSRLMAGVSDLRNTIETMRFTALANMTGNPAVSVPAGFIAETDPRGSGRIPAGLQCIGRHWEEPLLLRIARVAEGLIERPRPEVFLPPIDEHHLP